MKMMGPHEYNNLSVVCFLVLELGGFDFFLGMGLGQAGTVQDAFFSSYN